MPPIKERTLPLLKNTLSALCAAAVLLGAAAQTAAQTPENKSPAADGQETSIRSTLESLYNDYETIDNSLNAAKKTSSQAPTLSGHTILIPLTITIKKSGNFRLTSVDVNDNGFPLWGHIYTDTENEGLDKGGRHYLYRAETTGGRHTITIEYDYAPSNDPKNTVKKQSAWTYTADRETVAIEIVLEKSGNNVVAKPTMLRVIERK